MDPNVQEILQRGPADQQLFPSIGKYLNDARYESLSL